MRRVATQKNIDTFSVRYKTNYAVIGSLGGVRVKRSVDGGLVRCVWCSRVASSRIHHAPTFTSRNPFKLNYFKQLASVFTSVAFKWHLNVALRGQATFYSRGKTAVVVMARANTHSFTIHAHKRVRKQKLEQVLYSKVGHILQQKIKLFWLETI